MMANEGVEEGGFTEPRKAGGERGAEVDVIAPEGGQIQAFNPLDKGDTFTAGKSPGDSSPDRYGGVVPPGGVANPDELRTDEDAVNLVRAFFEAGKPVGVI